MKLLPDLHEPGGNQADHGVGVGPVSTFDYRRIEDGGRDVVVVVEDVLEEEEVAIHLDKGEGEPDQRCALNEVLFPERCFFFSFG